MKKILYLPILKGKRAEFNALEALSKEIKSFIYPLIEIEPVAVDSQTNKPEKSYNDHLSNYGKKAKSLDSIKCIMIDGLLIEEEYISSDDIDPLSNVINQLRANNIKITPVSSPTRSFNYKQRVKELIEDCVCLRLRIADLMTPQLILDYILELKISYNKIDIIIDLYDLNSNIMQNSVEELAITIKKTINSFPFLEKIRSISLAAGSFPVDMTKIDVGVKEIPRLEWELWNILRNNKKLNRAVLFSDYSIQHPGYTRLPVKFPSVSASIRYTGENTFVIFRGKDPKKHGYDQYKTHCQLITQHKEYAGANFCFGDEKILSYSLGQVLKSKNEPTYGSPETWRKIGTNHHITKVVNQISNLF